MFKLRVKSCRRLVSYENKDSCMQWIIITKFPDLNISWFKPHKLIKAIIIWNLSSSIKIVNKSYIAETHPSRLNYGSSSASLLEKKKISSHFCWKKFIKFQLIIMNVAWD